MSGWILKRQGLEWYLDKGLVGTFAHINIMCIHIIYLEYSRIYMIYDNMYTYYRKQLACHCIDSNIIYLVKSLSNTKDGWI